MAGEELKGERRKAWVGDALLGTIRTKDIDLVVLGTHGRRGLRKLVLGSVAEEVFRLAPCPVLTVGLNTTEAPSEPLFA